MNGRSIAGMAFGAVSVIVAVAVLCGGVAAVWIRGRFTACLPRLDGTWALHGLAAPVSVSRDALGVPTITGSSRIDVARATGWLHAQDRFFQMDTLRRRGAGELSELFGGAAIKLDREARMHGFRRLAREVLARESPGRRELVEAYTQGVNAGLKALGAKPWEYVALRTDPLPWLPEDCVLITYAMTLDLQEGTGQYVRSLAAVRDTLGRASLAFFAPLSTAGDAPLDGSPSSPAPIPPASEVDLRKRVAEEGAPTARAGTPDVWKDGESPGSNSFAVAGPLAAGGGAMVANDTHLRLGVPNIWYRVSLRWPGHDETGITIPGAPLLVAGSTGRIAWGFTNSNAGVGDIVIVNPSISPELYHGPDGGKLVPYERRTETVPVRGAKPVSMEFIWTAWGPVVGDSTEGRKLVFHWTEDDPAATNLDILELEDALDVRAAVAVAHHVGIPLQNFVVADSRGHIAWTVAGAVPRRIGYDGRLPVTWAFGDRRWDGFLSTGEIPAIVDPGDGMLWTANNRIVGGNALAVLGDSGYAIAARARQIRDDLAERVRVARPVEPKDLLAIQLDDRARLLEYWHSLLVATLRPEVVAGKSSRGAILEAIQKWEGRAETDSVSYGVVRAFRLAVAHRVFDSIFAPCVEQDPDFTWTKFNYEQPLETIVRERPPHLLDPSFATWDELLAAAVDDVSATYRREGADPRSATWGRHNTARIAHPFARSLPGWAARWLSMPADPLPGDSNMPRIQEPAFGASVRFVVSPGHEAAGIFQMPGGESSNPLSPYFRAGHDAWVSGRPTAFLPGAAEHSLVLDP